MAENSKISWTTHTFNPWMGCMKVHAGCTHCYAEEQMDTRYGKVKWGGNGTRVLTSDANWRKPLKWNREAAIARMDHEAETNLGKDLGEYVRPRVFCASLADIFEDWQGGSDADGAMTCYRTGEELSINENGRVWPAGWPSMSDGDDWGIRPFTMKDARERLFRLIDATPNLDWLLLTKRPENIPAMWCSHANTDGKPPSMLPRRNVWLGTSVSEQAHADKQIPELIECRNLSPVLFISAEPLLGPIDLAGLAYERCPHCIDQTPDWETNVVECRRCEGTGVVETYLDWAIAGAESGNGYREMPLAAIESLADQCEAAGIAFHCKQDNGLRSGERGRLSDRLWAMKQFPSPLTTTGANQ